MCIHIYIYIYMHMYIYIYIHIYISKYHTDTYIYVFLHTCKYIGKPVSLLRTLLRDMHTQTLTQKLAHTHACTNTIPFDTYLHAWYTHRRTHTNTHTH